MATSVAPPAASSPPSSNYDQIAALTSVPSEPSQAESAEPKPEPASEAQPQETTVETVPETGAQEEVKAEPAAAAPEPEAEDNPYEREEADEDFKPQTLTEILRTKDGKRMLANDKAMRAMTKELGFSPTIEQAKEHYGSHRAITLMEHDLNSGNPQQAERLLSHLFNPQRGEGPNAVAAQIIPTLAKSNPAALMQMIPQLATLEKSNPEAYAEAGVPFVTSYGKALWDRVISMADPAKWEGSLKQALYFAAQAVHKDLTGKYRPEDEQPTQAAKQEDPFAGRAAELDAKAAQISQFEQRQQQAAAQQWTSEFGKSVATGLFAELDKALIPLKKMYEATPAKYERSRKFFHDQITGEVPKNKQAWDLYQVRVAEARRAGSPEQMEAAAKEYVRLAVPVIMAKRKAFLEEEGATVQAASNARHSELRSIDSQKALNGSGASPVTPGKGPPIQRMPGESTADFNMRQLLH